jgi:hypothetical protein
MGLEHPPELAPRHVVRRINATHVASFDAIYAFASPDALLDGTAAERMQRYWDESSAGSFRV